MAPRKGDGRLDIAPGGRGRSAEEAPRPRRTDEPRRAEPRLGDARGAKESAPRKRAGEAPEVRRAAETEPRRAAEPARAAAKAPARAAAASGRRRVELAFPRKRRRIRPIRVLFRATLALGLLAVLAVGGVVAYYAATLPPPSEWAVPARPPNVAILSERGELIANRGDTGGREVAVADLPPHVAEAVIAIEDRRFYQHPGIDPVGLARAVATNLLAGRLEQGGSTLTQQLAKNLFLSPSRTLERKIQEMVFAVWLEMEFSKDAILAMYLNRVYLGAGAYGVEAAAQRYFSKPAEALTLPEAALLAGLLKAPSYFAPTADLQRSHERAATVLAAMRDAGFITAEEEAAARANPAQLQAPPVAASGGYVADWVAEVLPGYAGAVDEDIVVETTIDLGLQELAQTALRDMLAEEGAAKGVSQGAVVVMDAAGAVKALVGGRSYEESQFNRAVEARRQPGSAFKPFVYLAALEHGLRPETMRIDQPTRIGNWSPENYTREYYGPVSLSNALARSLNTISAQLIAEVGPEAVVRTAQRLGIRSALEPNASLALGTSEVTPLEMTAAFVPFSNGGLGVIPHVVRRIKTVDGELLYERRGAGLGQVVSEADVGAMNRMMAAALQTGTAQRAQIGGGWEAAGKTGTSQNWRDAWFVGYTAYFTAGVWLGNDDGTPTKRTSGGTLPAALWRTLMDKVHEGMVAAELPGVDRIEEIIAEGDPAFEEVWTDPAQARTAAVPPPENAGVWVRREQPGEGNFFRRLFGGG